MALLVLAVALAGCETDREATTTVSLEDTHLSDVSAWGFSYRGVSGWLVSREDGGVDAFWARSPHLGCAVHPVDSGPVLDAAIASKDLGPDTRGVFFDPCGNSVWLFTGERIFGPTPRGLDRFDATLETSSLGDDVIIDFSTVRLGVCSPGVKGDVRCSSPGSPTYVDGPPLYDWP